MATVTVAHKPELTGERVLEVFRSHFASEYEVYKPTFYGRVGTDCVVKKTAWTGVRVKLKQGKDDTTLVFTPFLPTFVLVLVLAGLGLIPYLLATSVFLRPSWKALEDEVRLFIENAAEFK